tara:strand:- start:37 stop:513 length:477 start_codon:yes stop_codon:yes gene_type:complete
MIGELAILLKGLDSAFNLVQAGIERKKSLDQMSKDIDGFFRKKEAAEDAILKAKNSNELQMSSLEEARAIEELEYQIEKQMESIGRYYSRQGRSPAWARIKDRSAKIQREKELKAKKKSERNEDDDLLIRQIGLAFIYMFVGFAVIAGIAFFIFGVEQ